MPENVDVAAEIASLKRQVIALEGEAKRRDLPGSANRPITPEQEERARAAAPVTKADIEGIVSAALAKALAQKGTV